MSVVITDYGREQLEGAGMIERWAAAMEEMVGAMTAEMAQDFYDQISLAELGEDRPATFREHIGALTPGAEPREGSDNASF